MNELFTLEDLETLIAHQGKPAISIYLPTSRIPTRVQAESLQFKNLVREAESQLEEFDLRGPEIRAMLEPAQALVGDAEFWRHQKDGLAVFISQDRFLRYQLPITFETELTVAQNFRAKPILPMLIDNTDFYILAVSQNNVRLLRASQYSAEELDPATIPTSLAEALRYEEPEGQVRFHTSAGAPTGASGTGFFFGHSGSVADDDKDQLRRFFQQIDQGLRDYLKDETPPLVFAGVDYLFPIYRDANTYPHLVESSITGNPQELQPDALRHEAWKLIEPKLKAKREADIDAYHSLAPHGQASAKLDELVPWADQGRVLTAFVDKNAAAWGTYDAEKFTAEVQGVHTPDNRDLTDLFAILTLLRKGNVHLLSSEQMEMEFGSRNRHLPQEEQQNSGVTPVAAAIYRYAT